MRPAGWSGRRSGSAQAGTSVLVGGRGVLCCTGC